MARNNQIVKEEQGNKPVFGSQNNQQNFQTPATGTNKPPAWLGNNPVSATNNPPAWLSGGGAGAGGGNYNEPEEDQPYRPSVPFASPQFFEQQFQQGLNQAAGIAPTPSGPVIPGTNIPISQAKPGGQLPAVPHWIKPQPTFNADEMIDNQFQNDLNQAGGGQYSGHTIPGTNIPLGTPTAALTPNTMIPTYQGMPVNNSLSDTLRGVPPPKSTPVYGGFQTPFTNGFTAANPFKPRPTPSSPTPSYGFGTQYGGNWGGGGGGGGGGGDWGGGGYGGDNPAWAQDMGLYSWKFG